MENREDTLVAIKKLIYKKLPNTIWGHLKTWFEGNENHYYGSVDGNKFQVWRFSKGAQGFHPVIFGEVNLNEHTEPEIHLKPILNPLGVLQSVIGTIGMIILAFVIIPSEMNSILVFLLALLIVGMPIFIVLFIYRYETKYHLAQLKEKLKV